jgi:hypothetical protein
MVANGTVLGNHLYQPTSSFNGNSNDFTPEIQDNGFMSDTRHVDCTGQCETDRESLLSR